MSFTNIFTGLPTQPSTVSSQVFNLDSNVTLNWATSFVDSSNVIGGQNNVFAETTESGAPWIITLPPANEVSPGQQMMFNCLGSEPFEVNTHDGFSLVVMQPTESWIISLFDNSTIGGEWTLIQIGSTTSTAQASMLAGLGTTALNGLLNTNIPNKTLTTNYTILASDRASLLVNGGGSVTYTLPVIDNSTTIFTGFYIGVNNAGTGSITLTGSSGQLIDLLSTSVLNPGESAYYIASQFSGGALTWYSLGKGIPTFFADSVLSLTVTGGTVTLTTQQNNNNIIQFSGTLTSNSIILFNANAGSWYMQNNTTGSFTLTVQLNNGTDPGVEIPQGATLIVYSNGVNMMLAPSIQLPSTFTFPSGTVGTPGMRFTDDPSTGFYDISIGNVGFSSAGTQTIDFTPTQLLIAPQGNTPCISFIGDTDTGITHPSNDTLNLTTNNNVALSINSTQNITLTNPLGISSGGTLRSSLTTYGILAGGTTNTGAIQQISNGTSGQLLQSNGVSTLAAYTTATYPTTAISNALLGCTTNNVISTLSTIPSGITWNGNIIPGQFGGTGVNNSGKTITLGANLTTSGSNNVTFTTTGATNVTLPTTGTLSTLASQSGSFTPSLFFDSSTDIAYSTQSGSYYSVGKMVMFTLVIQISALNLSAGRAFVNCTNLPNANSDFTFPSILPASVYYTNMSSGLSASQYVCGSPVVTSVSFSGFQIQLTKNFFLGWQGATSLLAIDFLSNSVINISGMYVSV